MIVAYSASILSEVVDLISEFGFENTGLLVVNNLCDVLRTSEAHRSTYQRLPSAAVDNLGNTQGS
jgi:hypothetical protein